MLPRDTPSLLLFDRDGRLRLNHFGSIDDMVLGGVIGRMLAEQHGGGPPCDADGCVAPS